MNLAAGNILFNVLMVRRACRAMHIYIDEAGSFTTFREPGSSISCVAALVVPESVHDELLAEFQALSRHGRSLIRR